MSSPYDQLAGLIDNAVALWSPETAMRRMLQRDRLQEIDKVREQYAAAKSNRLTGTWSPLNENVNTLIEASSANVRARVRQLVRDFPVLATARRKIENYTVGTGHTLQCRVKRVSGKVTIDKETNQAIEDAWERWKEEADISGKLHLDEMAALAKGQDVECGEFLLVKTRSTAKNRFLPLAYQIVEPDWLTDLNAIAPAKRVQISQGVEYDTMTGEVKAYHLAAPDGMWGNSYSTQPAKRYPADRILHKFKTVRPGQLRGISALAAAVLLARDVDEMMQAELDASKLAAKYLAFVTTPDPEAWQNSLAETDSETGQRVEELTNAIIQYKRHGERVDFASNPRPGSNFAPFVKLCLRFMAIVSGIPYAILSGDYENLPYSAARIARNDMLTDLVPEQTRHSRHFYTPIFRAFLDEAVLTGRLTLPGYWQRPHMYQRCEWFPPIVPSPEPLKDMKTDIEGMKAGIVSPYEVCRRRGRDAEEILHELAKFNGLAKELDVDINLGAASTAEANNPAAMIDGLGDEDEGDALNA